MLRYFRTNALVLLFFLPIAMLVGCGKDGPQAPPAMEVKYVVVKGQPLRLSMELPGRVSAFMVSEVRPQVSGILKNRFFNEGADVVEGQPLYQIDPALYQAAYDSAKATLARAQANLTSARLLAQRYAEIVKVDAISKQEYDDAKAAYEQIKAEVDAAKAALETARINLGYTQVIAPVSGRIGPSFQTPGALVTQNQPTPLATVQQLSPVYVDVTQSNAEMLKLRRAFAAGRLRSSGPESAKVRLKLEDGSPYAKNFAQTAMTQETEWIEGDLLFSDVTIEQSTGVVTIRAKFDNPDTILLPGMYVRAILEEGLKDQSILIPQRTVMRDPRNNPYVYVLSKEKPVLNIQTTIQAAPKAEDTPPDPALEADQYYVIQRPVVIDRDYQNQWLINSGLQAGDMVMTDGLIKVRPGMVVKASPDSTDSKSGQGEKR